MNSELIQEPYIKKIENLREKMVHAAKQYGMAHPLVLRYSQELDQVINVKMMMNKHSI